MPRKSALKKKTGEKTFFARYDPKNTLVVQRAPKKPMLNKCMLAPKIVVLKKYTLSLKKLIANFQG